MARAKTKLIDRSILLNLKLAATTLVWAQTTEEERLFDLEREALLSLKAATAVYRADCTGRVTEYPSGREATFDSPTDIISWFASRRPEGVTASPAADLRQDFPPSDSVIIMLDISFQLQQGNGGQSKHSNPLLTRTIKNVLPNLSDDHGSKMIVIVSHTMDVPPELEHKTPVVKHALPDYQEISDMVRKACGFVGSSTPISLSPEESEAICGMLVGLRQAEIDNALARSVQENAAQRHKDPSIKEGFDLATLRAERVRSVQKNSTLEIIHPEGGLDLVGGLADLKAYFKDRRKIFSKEAEGEGLSAPKGTLLCGLSGTGKTLLSACIGAEWGATVLRGDVSACKAGLVGASESNFRKLLNDAESMAGENVPVVLQLDEAGKMFGAGLKGQALDSGVSTGLSAIFLTWRQNCKKDVYVIMTANEDAQNFPMEWLRPGRIDKVFFVDLPDAEGRKEVCRIHLKKRNWACEDIDLEAVAKATEGFTPAEVEQVVENAILIKFNAGLLRPNPVTTDHLLKACSGVKPMSVTNKEEIDALRAWAAAHGYTSSAGEPIFASSTGVAAVKPSPGRRISRLMEDMDDDMDGQEEAV